MTIRTLAPAGRSDEAARCSFLPLRSRGSAPADETDKRPWNSNVRHRSTAAGLPMSECDFGVHRIKLIAKVDKKGEGTAHSSSTHAQPGGRVRGRDHGQGRAAPETRVHAQARGARRRCSPKARRAHRPSRSSGSGTRSPGRKSSASCRWPARRGPSGPTPASCGRPRRGRTARLVVLPRAASRSSRTVRCRRATPAASRRARAVQTPGGTKVIEDLRAGDVITTIGTDGKPGQGKVAAMFVTKNRLVEVNVEGKTLITTLHSAARPSADGKLRAGGRTEGR